MKKIGNVCDFTQERNAELCRMFRRLIHEADYIDLQKIFRKMARTPVPRFYVSESRAFIVINERHRSGKWTVKGELRQAMYEEIYRRALEMLERGDFDNLYDCVFEAVNTPAPRFYLTPRSCRTLLYNALHDKNKASKELRNPDSRSYTASKGLRNC